MTIQIGRTAPLVAAALVMGFSASPGRAVDADGADRPDPDMAQKGKQIYAAHCSHCHGFNMVSAGTVTFDLREFPRNQRERFFESVTNGKNNRMPPWGDALSQDEIDEIWAYVLTGGKP